MVDESTGPVSTEDAGLLAIIASLVLVTTALVVLFGENGTYSTEGVALLGGLGLGIVGLVLMLAARRR